MDHHHGSDGMEDMCSMNMLFNVGWQNLCIVFPSWHIRSFSAFLFSLLAIVALGAGYEAVREFSRRVEMGITNSVALRDDRDDVDEGDRSSRQSAGRAKIGNGAQAQKPLRAFLYAAQVFYSFFIMLLFMTYNLWVMLAVAVGAFVGFMMFSKTSATRSVACH